ncbi:Muramoyltetrapeptide carboxypeptidase LdcA (peptidoglycan recycling) [Pedobacter steynii]|uniref:Muramoyltetrapeptide carboxypeptidase LdcA (Peptidoglycan recycling) n=1 Tax=Pedobacter steynii TaxID=430522 RepID=A0A1G9K9A6_9SPHI|nr:S66 peptidase family protein [Pedobacter steynii]NQX38485.1 LD-carboxypeptidase [Pedobacter steynii]SDL46219.1 Muramoyltetrapeptide carboxypeptidase LdcA (peptidoglycan recycling) [Pedobacter steynii]
MNNLIKPKPLQTGDVVAAVSLSAGLAGTIPYRYEIGKKQLEEEFSIKLIEMPHTLKDITSVKNNPKERAADLMAAFSDPEIKAIFTCIGGEDSIRILPYIDFEVIRSNPKIFLGYSDTTVTHMICLKAGLTSFYGPAILSNFAENQGILSFTAEQIRKAIFSTIPVGKVHGSPVWTAAHLDWFEPENQKIKRPLLSAPDRKLLQGQGIVKGRLIGGCVQTLITIVGTELWPNAESWNSAIIFLDISESELPLNIFRYFLRNIGTQGILQSINAIILGRPGGQRSIDECEAYENELINIIALEFGRPDLPILSRMDFGHTDPMMTLPYGVLAELNCSDLSFSIKESGVE